MIPRMGWKIVYHGTESSYIIGLSHPKAESNCFLQKANCLPEVISRLCLQLQFAIHIIHDNLGLNSGFVILQCERLVLWKTVKYNNSLKICRHYIFILQIQIMHFCVCK